MNQLFKNDSIILTDYVLFTLFYRRQVFLCFHRRGTRVMNSSPTDFNFFPSPTWNNFNLRKKSQTCHTRVSDSRVNN